MTKFFPLCYLERRFTSKFPNTISDVLLQRLTIDYIINRKTSLNKYTGLDLSEYRVLRKKFVDKNSAHLKDCEAFHIDIMILASMWMVRKAKHYEQIALKFHTTIERACSFVEHGIYFLSITYDPINVITIQRMLENEEGFFEKSNKTFQGLGYTMDYTPVDFKVGTDGFLLFLAVNSTKMIESLELQQYCESDEVSEEDLLLETSFMNRLILLPKIFFYCRNNKCFHLEEEVPVLTVSGGGDRKLDKENVIRHKVLNGYITPFEKTQDKEHLEWIEQSKKDFGTKFYIERFPIESLCGNIKRTFAFFKMQFKSIDPFFLKLIVTVIAQIYNANHGHFYIENHLCAEGCNAYRMPVKVKLAPEQQPDPNYLERAHQCMMGRQRTDADHVLVSNGCSAKSVTYTKP